MSESYIAGSASASVATSTAREEGLSSRSCEADDVNVRESSERSDTSESIPGLRLRMKSDASGYNSTESAEGRGTPMRKKHDSIPRDFALFVTETLTPKSKKASSKTLSDWEAKQVKSTRDALISEADLKVNVSECLGEGSFGSVFRGTYKGENVAVKRIELKTPGRSRRTKNAPPTPQQYLDREISLVMNLKHKNLVKLFGVVLQPPSRLLLVMEYLSGGNMRQFWQEEKKRKRPNDWKELARNLAGAAEGLDYLHSIEVIHRDIKTENVALSDRSSSKRCVLLDFGLARKESLNGRMTIVGTDSFMSPEVMLGEEYSITADIFSFGVVIAEMICRILPNTPVAEIGDAASGKKKVPLPLFMARKPQNLFVLDLALFRKLSAKRGCPDALVSLALSCLEYEPCDRPDAPVLVETLQSLAGLGAESDESNSSDEDTEKKSTVDVLNKGEEEEEEDPANTGSSKESDESATASGSIVTEETVRAESVVRDRASSDVPSQGSRAVVSDRTTKATLAAKDDGVLVEDAPELSSDRNGLSGETWVRKGSTVPSVGKKATRLPADAVASKTTSAAPNTVVTTTKMPVTKTTTTTTKKKKRKGQNKKQRRASEMAASLGLDLSKIRVGVASSKHASPSDSDNVSQYVEKIEVVTTSRALLKRAKGPSSKGRRPRRPKKREKKPLLTSNSGAILEVTQQQTKHDAQESATAAVCGGCVLL